MHGGVSDPVTPAAIWGYSKNPINPYIASCHKLSQLMKSLNTEDQPPNTRKGYGKPIVP